MTLSASDDRTLHFVGRTIAAGTIDRAEVEFGNLPTGTPLPLPFLVAHGTEPGPRLWLSAGIHGDEVNGAEIIRLVIDRLDPKTLRGTVIGVPIVNVYGFVGKSRYLPDRRDLNRSFPGSAGGSLAARLAHLFMREIVHRSTHGIDLHTGSDDRTNLPHIRADLSDPETLACARAFGTSLLVDARTRDGSLRQAAAQAGIPCLLYEGGEANRFETDAIEHGVRGIERVMRHLGMIDRELDQPGTARMVSTTRWVRARGAGIARLSVRVGDEVDRGQPLGVIRDALGKTVSTVRAPDQGTILGLSRAPLVHRGDGLVHVALHRRDTAAQPGGQ